MRISATASACGRRIVRQRHLDLLRGTEYCLTPPDEVGRGGGQRLRQASALFAELGSGPSNSNQGIPWPRRRNPHQRSQRAVRLFPEHQSRSRFQLPFNAFRRGRYRQPEQPPGTSSHRGQLLGRCRIDLQVHRRAGVRRTPGNRGRCDRRWISRRCAAIPSGRRANRSNRSAAGHRRPHRQRRRERSRRAGAGGTARSRSHHGPPPFPSAFSTTNVIRRWAGSLSRSNASTGTSTPVRRRSSRCSTSSSGPASGIDLREHRPRGCPERGSCATGLSAAT